MSHPIKGYLSGSVMPASVAAFCGKPRNFADVHKTFVAMATTKAQDGGDYDIPDEPDCYDQQQEGACVIHSTIGCINILLALEGQSFWMPSRNFLYWLCRLVMGTSNQDSGTYVQLATFLLAHVGVCPETMWPYLQSNMFSAPTEDCYPPASDNKAGAWFMIPDEDVPGQPSRGDMMEAAIRANHPISFGTPVDNSIQTYQSGQVLGIPDPNAIEGGHSMAFTGVRFVNGARVFRVRNSWGKDYGDNGHLLMSEQFATWSSLTDRHVLTLADAQQF